MGSLHQSYEEFIAPHRFETPTSQLRLMEAICERNNMKSAIKRVIKNKGAPGVDGMTVRKIKRYLKRHWTKMEPIRPCRCEGKRFPSPVEFVY
jgi:RNA-directed DNA polymerase